MGEGWGRWGAYGETGRGSPDTRSFDVEDGRFVYTAGAHQAVTGVSISLILLVVGGEGEVGKMY